MEEMKGRNWEQRGGEQVRDTKRMRKVERNRVKSGGEREGQAEDEENGEERRKEGRIGAE